MLAANPPLPPHLVAPTDPLSPEQERQALTAPPGFEVQLVAAEPQIDKPIQMAFDGRGRLWVTTSRHYPFPAPAGQASDKLYVLSDIDPVTGRAGRVQVFANDLNIPIGILPLPDGRSCLVSSCGEIRQYTDTDGDGRADRREVLFQGFGYRDTHGMYNSFTLMPDGWVYACHGFANDSTVAGKDGHRVRMHSGHTFRFRPDGSRIEIFTYGQVNPFGMAVDPWGKLYTADCHSRPITQLIPQAYYESFGKPHDGLGFAPHVTRHDHGSTALCGLAWYDAGHYPAAWRGRMFIGNVVTNRVNCDRIDWKGSTPVAVEQPDFIVSRDRWFRPVDIRLGPDGALYIADFYNRIIGHYEVDLRHPGRDRERGRIWRVVWRGLAEQPAPPPRRPLDDLTTASLEQLERLRIADNLTVRHLVMQQIVHRFPDAAARLYPRPNAEQALRQLTLVSPENPQVPVDAADRPRQQRAAAEFFIEHPQAAAVEPLARLIPTIPSEDTHLRHAARIALRNCLRDTSDGWTHARLLLTRHPEAMAVLLDVLPGIPTAAAAEFLAEQWRAAGVTPERVRQRFGLTLEQYLAGTAHISRFGPASAAAVFEPVWQVPPPQRTAALQTAAALYRGWAAHPQRAATVSPALAALLRESLQASDPGDLRLALDALGQVLDGLSPQADRQPLQEWAAPAVERCYQQAGLPPGLHREAATLAIRHFPGRLGASLGQLLQDPAVPAEVREGVLVAAAGSPAALSQPLVAQAFREVLSTLPARQTAAVAVALAASRPGAELLLAMVQAGRLSPRLLQEPPVAERLRAHRLPAIDQRLAELTRHLPPPDRQTAELVRQRLAGFAQAQTDPAIGAQVFARHCAACHRLGGQGGTVAPQLDGIGQRGPERLLEDILDPHRNVDPAFRARVIVTTDERTLTALVVRRDEQELLLADADGKTFRLRRADIAAERDTPLSLMPANFGQILPEAELYHLLAYLLKQTTR